MTSITLENQALRLEFSRETGALCGLTAKDTGWRILDRPELGLSFRLLVPTRDVRDWHGEGRRNNPVYGEKQPLTSFEISPDGRKAVLVWDHVRSEAAGPLAIRVELQIVLHTRQVVYTARIENRSPYMVENVYCPYLGDLRPPGGEEWFRTFLAGYADPQEWSLWPTFQNTRGYYGVDHPVQFSWLPSCTGVPGAPFILLRGERQGLYVGAHANSAELVAWHTELRPGYGNYMESRVPETDTIVGKDTAIRFAAVHVPYILPGETRSLTPVVLEPFAGGWQAGADIYKTWRNGWMKIPSLPAWAREPYAWQQIHINSPEDELRVRFADLPKIGEECARYGVKAIQLVGWNDGGQDQGNPSHDSDPRLGRPEELKEAIEKIQAMGVKVILFVKFTWADRATDWFRRDLIRLAVKDPYGDYYQHNGYQYQTVTQLLDINTKRLIPMCFLAEEYLQICETEFQKVLDLGADGILFDESQHHGLALLCFDPEHGHRYGAPVYANDRQLIVNFRKRAGEAGETFFYAGEACYDWEMEAYHLSYFRTENRWHTPLARYLLPDALFMTAVTGFDDRNMINQCLMYRYIVSYEPYNFKGRLEDFPLTVAYGQKMEALRLELREYLWDGEFRHECGAEVTRVDGKRHHPYAVFNHRKNGRQAMVVSNYDREEIAVRVRLDSAALLSRYRLVDCPEWRRVEEQIPIPPYSAVVLIED